MKLRCKLCGESHTADSKHFPAVIRDKKDSSIIGYVCGKHAKEKSINKPLTRKDMKNLSYGGLPKKYQPRSKYSPNIAIKKERKENVK